MAVNKCIENIFRCPISGLPLRFLSDKEISLLLEKIPAFSLQRGGSVKDQFKEGLISSDERFIYPIVDDIIVLLPDLAIINSDKDPSAMEGVKIYGDKKKVRDFYDRLGWTQNSEGVFEDARKYEDLRYVSREYIHRCHLRVNRHLNDGGRYILDVASGPVQYEEYLGYHAKFDFRICADISILALREAQKKLRDKGIYVLADITNLPIKDNTMDCVLSLHTVYHVPAGEQVKAFGEIHRVLKPGARGIVVYSWGFGSTLMKIALLPVSALSIPLKLIRGAIKKPDNKSELQLYYHPHSYKWFKKNVGSKFDCKIYVWRSISIIFMKAYIHRWFFGRHLLSFICALEEKFPHFLGKAGQYPLIVMKKADAGG